MLDDIDRKILEILQADGRTTNVELARRIGMAPSAAFERVRRLEQRGVITGYAARVNPRAVDRPLLAYVLVRSDERINSSSAGEALARLQVDRTPVFYCKTGVRSAEVLAIAKKAGFSDALHVQGGIVAWGKQLEPDMVMY